MEGPPGGCSIAFICLVWYLKVMLATAILPENWKLTQVVEFAVCFDKMDKLFGGQSDCFKSAHEAVGKIRKASRIV